MSELQIHRDRYDGQVIIPQLIAERLQREGGQWVIETPFGEVEDFGDYFQTTGAQVEASLLDQARSLMLAIGDLDNRVQESCAADCKKSELHPRNFEGMLAFVTILESGAHLHYYGAGVNTEWDELTEMQNGIWTQIGVVPPKSTAVASGPAS